MTTALLEVGSAASPRSIARRFTLVASIRRLGGERDANHLVTSPDGSRHVLKVVGPDEAENSIPLQIAALHHLEHVAPDLPVPRVLATLDGDPLLPLDRSAAWMLTYCDGGMLSERPAEGGTLRALGRETGRIVAALAGFVDSRLDRPLAWRLDAAPDAARHLSLVADADARSLAAETLSEIHALRPALEQLPRQAIHGDLNPFNVVLDADGGVAGLIDFGDMHRGWRAGEVAIAVAYHLRSGEPGIAGLLGGFREHVALRAEERRLVPVLAAARLAMTLAITAAGAAARPAERRYILRNAPAALAGLRWLAGGGRERLAAMAERILG